MYQKINEYFESLLSEFPHGFRQGFSAQHCLLVMVSKEFLLWFSLTSLTAYPTVY